MVQFGATLLESTREDWKGNYIDYHVSKKRVVDGRSLGSSYEYENTLPSTDSLRRVREHHVIIIGLRYNTSIILPVPARSTYSACMIFAAVLSGYSHV